MRGSIRERIELAPAHTPAFTDQRRTIGASTKIAVEEVRVVDRFVGGRLTTCEENRKDGFPDSEITPKARENTHDVFELPLQLSF